MSIQSLEDEMSLLKSDLAGADKNISSLDDEENLLSQTLEQRGVDPYTEFSGDRTLGRAFARSGKSLTAGAVGGTADLVTAPYNISASVSNIKNQAIDSQKLDREAYARAESMGGEIPYMPYGGEVPTISSAVETIDKGIDNATQGYTTTPEDQKALQEGLKITGSMAGGVAYAKLIEKFGAESASHILKALSSAKGRDLIGGFTAGVTAEKMKEKGHNPLLAEAEGMGAGLAATLATIFTKGSAPKFLSTLGHDPKNYNVELYHAAQDIGMGDTAPIGLFNESKRYAGNEQIVQRTPIAGTKHNRNLSQANEEFVEKLRDETTNVGEQISRSSDAGQRALDVGTSIKQTLKEAEYVVKKEADFMYEQAKHALPADKMASLTHVEAEIKKLREMTRTLKDSRQQTFLTSWLNDIEKKIYKTEGKEATLWVSPTESKAIKPKKVSKEVDINDVVGTKISLNDDIDWNPEAAGVKELLKGLKGAFDKDIAVYGTKSAEHGKWFGFFKKADSFYGKYLGDETGLANSTLKGILNQEDPEKILSKLNNVSDFVALEGFLGKTKEGQKFFESIKREKLDSIFAKGMESVLESKDGRISWHALHKNLADPSKAVLIKHLAGEQTYKQLQSFAKYAEGMTARFKRNPNASGSAQEGMVLAVIGGAIGGGGGIISAAKGLGKAALAGSILSWAVTNRKLMNIALNAAKASAEGRGKDALKWGAMLDKSFAEEFGESALKQLAQQAGRISDEDK